MRAKKNIEVGLFDSNTDYGRVGYASSRRGALRLAKRAYPYSTNGGYSGYMYTVRLYDRETGQEIETIRV